eukprot:6214484-Pleurochrysis_carterae.AAC.1
MSGSTGVGKYNKEDWDAIKRKEVQGVQRRASEGKGRESHAGRKSKSVRRPKTRIWWRASPHGTKYTGPWQASTTSGRRREGDHVVSPNSDLPSICQVQCNGDGLCMESS